jgi:hypothetical protein
MELVSNLQSGTEAVDVLCLLSWCSVLGKSARLGQSSRCSYWGNIIMFRKGFFEIENVEAGNLWRVSTIRFFEIIAIGWWRITHRISCSHSFRSSILLSFSVRVGSKSTLEFGKKQSGGRSEDPCWLLTVAISERSIQGRRQLRNDHNRQLSLHLFALCLCAMPQSRWHMICTTL